MKITKTQIIPLKYPGALNSNYPLPSYIENGIIIFKLYTDEGLVGYGEPNPYFVNLNDLKLASIDILDKLINLDPIEVLNDDFKVLKHNKLNKNKYVPVIAGISQAIYDLVGKINQIPSSLLLNDKTDLNNKIKAYASGGMIYESTDINIIIEEANKCRASGFDIWKMRPPLPFKASHIERTNNPPPINFKKTITILEELNIAVPELKIIIDFGCRLKMNKFTIEFLKELASFNVIFFEEPIPRNIKNYFELKKAINFPISGGEVLNKIKDFEDWINNRAYDIIQPDSNLTGIAELFKIINLGKQRNIKCILHNWTNSLNTASNLQVALASKSVEMIEYNIIKNPLNEILFDVNFEIDNGYYKLKEERSGLGVNLNEGLINKNLMEIK